MAAKEYLKGLLFDTRGAIIDPSGTARRIKEKADLEYGLKVVIASAALFFTVTLAMSFFTDNFVFVYSCLFNRSCSLDYVFKTYAGILEMLLWVSFVYTLIGLPSFIFASFIYAAIFWFSGKLFGGKTPFIKFYGSMIPIQMSLVLSLGLFSVFLSDLTRIICAIASISTYREYLITFTLFASLTPPVALIQLYYYARFMEVAHEMQRKDAYKAVAIPVALFMILCILVYVASAFFASFLKDMLPFYDGPDIYTLPY